MSHGPWARSSGTTRMKALLLPSSGLNFLRMPSCHRIRHGRGGVVQWGGTGGSGAAFPIPSV